MGGDSVVGSLNADGAVSMCESPPSGGARTGHIYAFVVGLHRSGTSILFKTLREHPDISGFRDTGVPEDEGQHLESVLPKDGDGGGPGRMGFSSRMHLTEADVAEFAPRRETLFAEWLKHWDFSRPCLLEKSPPTILRTRLIQEMFKPSYFIAIMRHPLAVSFSTRKLFIRNSTIGRLVEHWLHCHELLAADMQHLRHSMLIKYEDFVADPQTELDRILAFLGLAPCPVKPTIRDANRKYLRLRKGWWGGKKQLVHKYEAAVRRYGYSLLDW